MKGSPSVSILLPVYNSVNYIERTIDSLLNQTYSDFELVIVNDGSTDGTEDVINKYTDSRIRLIQLPVNKGLVNALNTGLDVIDADYIVRMDADDISAPTRIEKQLAFMESHPDIGVSGCWYNILGIGLFKLGCTHEEIKFQMLNRAPLHHSSAIIRGEVLTSNNIKYNSDFEYSEDMDLWMRLIKITKFANIPDVLLSVTPNIGQHTKYISEASQNNLVLRKAYLNYLFPDLSSGQCEFLSRCFNRVKPRPLTQQDFITFVDTIKQLSLTYSNPILDKQLAEGVWFQLANNAPRSIMWIAPTRVFPWNHIPIWKFGWLFVKPLVKRFR